MNIREYSLNALIDIDKEKAYSNLAVKEYLKKYSFTAEDKALFTNIVYGVITHKKYLLYVLSRYVKRPHKQVFWVKNLLLLSAYQLLFLNIPEFAITSESVKIAKKKGGPTKGNFINGVLRSIIRDKGNIQVPKEDNTEYLSIKYSLPKWMVEEFEALFDDLRELEDFCQSLNEPLPITIRVNTLKTTKDQLITKLSDLGIEFNHSRVCDDGLILMNKTPISRVQHLLDEGLCTIQDQSSIKVGETVDPKPGEHILDMCAAPGGKSTHLAQIMQNKGSILSCDIHPHKLDLINELTLRLGISIINTEYLDGTNSADKLKGRNFDKILLDAPCSGLGVIPGKPDIKWNKEKEDIAEIAKIQWSLLENAAALLRSGGELVYSTCTLTKQENEDMIDNFINEFPNFKKEKEIKLFPHKDKCHGFYIAKLTKLR